MAGQYSKEVILAKLREKVVAKGFSLQPQGDTQLPAGTPTIDDALQVIAESLAEILEKGTLPAKLQSSSFKIGPQGIQQPVATKAMPGMNNVKFDMTTDPTFFTWAETFHGLLQAVYPEPGNGSPNVFATALKALLALKPTSLNGKIISGSATTKVTI
jgi:hypothetical protein